MTLATRLSAFFLGALALILLGFSLVLYFLASDYLYDQLDARLDTVLDTLQAAVEVESEGLEWEPEDRYLMHGIEPGIEHVRWVIYGDDGVLVDISSNARGVGFPPKDLDDFAPRDKGDRTAFAEENGWRLGTRRLTLEEMLASGKKIKYDDDDDDEHLEMVLLAGVKPDPVAATLRVLGLALFGTSSLVWLLCAALGRTVIRRALAPLSKMAHSARSLSASDPGWGLPMPGTGDELDELALAYNDLLARLQEEFERQRRFAGDASHQLRTPLAGLLGQLDVALRRDRSAEEYRRTLHVARDEADRLRRITEALLFLARPEAEGVVPDTREIELARWLPEQLRRWANHPRAGDLQLQPAPEPGLGVRAHPVLLAQLLDNFIDNAIKYSKPGSPILIGAWPEGSNVSLAVDDRGTGLSAEDQAHIFEPFYRSEQARRHGRAGSGLGLAVAMRIANLFGGSLDVSSTPGVGSRFRLLVPSLWVPPTSSHHQAPEPAWPDHSTSETITMTGPP